MLEKLSVGRKEIILVGTAHISQESVALVRKTIESENPDCVGVELDSQRLEQLKSGNAWKETDVSKIIKDGKSHLFLVNLMLSSMQRKFGEAVGVSPGSEMLEAVKISEEKNIPLCLLDRDIKITMKRALASMGIMEKAKLGYSVLEGLFSDEKISAEEIEKLKEKDLLTEVMAELGKSAPFVKRVLVDERDSYIAEKIKQASGKKIVAVVGAGHLDGIKKNLQKPAENISDLEIVSEKKSLMKYFVWAIPILLIGILAYGFYLKGPELILKASLTWILVTGGLSAIAVLLARGHILSAITAFVAAPITTIHPALASGWFAAAMEAKINTPKVKDFESLRELRSVGDFFKNRVTKILMVAAFSNLGSMIGVFIALPMVAGLVS